MKSESTQALHQQFEAHYLQPAEGLSSAPGRVNLIGEFTDYNRGFVLPCSLQFRTRVLYRRRADNQVVVRSLNYPGEQDNFDLNREIGHGPSSWGNYIRAVAYVLKRQGHDLCGLELLIDSDVPQGSGLSSSAALEVAVGGAFNAACGLDLSTEQIALFGQRAENDFMDCRCGIMDQLISAKGEPGQALLIDCNSLQTTPVAIPDDLTIVIVDSNYPRKLVDSEYNQRRLDCEQVAATLGAESLRQVNLAQLNAGKAALSDNEYKRAHHVISENARVLAAVDALQHNDMTTLCDLMAASHRSLRNDFEVTVPATDGLVDIITEALQGRGAVRMTGGGFGGAIVCLCRTSDVEQIEQAVERHYFAQFGLTATVHVCRPGSGLQIG